MGHREELLVGAKRCLVERGYARTSARDIVVASGTNLASIGYHYGSKDALLNRALIESIAEWGQALARVLEKSQADPSVGPLERFELAWTGVVELFAGNRQLWVANFEVLAQIDHVPEIASALVEANTQGRPGLSVLFSGIETDRDDAAWKVGTFHQALLTGVMAQWLIDPASAPTGRDLADALRFILADIPRDGLADKARGQFDAV